jgi:hypothetical protein
VEKLHAEVFVAIGKNDCRDHDFVVDDAADRVSRAIHLRGDYFNDYSVTTVRRLHWANPSVVEACIRRSLSELALAVTGREMPVPAAGIALAADGSMRSRLLHEIA